MPLHHRLLLSAGLLLLLVSSLAGAAAKRTFVASHGVDNPNCSIVAPCRNLSAAITATNAGGEVIVQDSAGYGAVTITKSVSIIVPPGIYGGISVLSGNGVTINAPGATVVLRGLSINGQGGTHGILLQQAARVRVESCVVSNMAGVGVYHQADNGEMIVLDTISRDNGDAGFSLVARDASIVLDHVRSEHNVNVGFYMAPVVPATSASAMVTNSLFAHNGGNGVWADTVGGATTYLQVERSIFSGNGQHGVYATAGAGAAYAVFTLTRNAFDLDGGPTGSAIYLLATFGFVSARATENSFTSSYLTVDGTNSYLNINGNSGGGSLFCTNGGKVFSYRNNYIDGTFCTITGLGPV